MPPAALAAQGFGFCVTPVQPTCVRDDATFKSPDRIRICEDEIHRWEISAVGYRDCVLREMQHTVGDLNDAVTAFRCRTAPRAECR